MIPETIKVRGIPINRDEVIAKELEIGGMLFDEPVFKDRNKKEACANVLRALDRKLKVYQQTFKTKDLPPYLDIGDRSWLYVPVNLFPPDSYIVVIGKAAWFRVKRYMPVTKL